MEMLLSNRMKGRGGARKERGRRIRKDQEEGGEKGREETSRRRKENREKANERCGKIQGA